MELAHMGSLYNVLRNPTFNPTWESTLEFGIDAAEGMAFLHALQPPLLHRDLKTLNLMVSNQMKIKVGDFGLSIFDNTNKSEGSMTGTAAYLAPEILEGVPFTVKADVYAFAVVFWELVNTTLKQEYETPFAEYKLALDMQILFAVSSRDVRPSLAPACPAEVVNFLKACWSKVPEDRPDFPTIISQLKDLQVIFNERKAAWNEAIRESAMPHENNSNDEPGMIMQQEDADGGGVGIHISAENTPTERRSSISYVVPTRSSSSVSVGQVSLGNSRLGEVANNSGSPKHNSESKLVVGAEISTARRDRSSSFAL